MVEEIKCLVCKEECSSNLSDVESVCFSCVQKIVADYLDLHDE